MSNFNHSRSGATRDESNITNTILRKMMPISDEKSRTAQEKSEPLLQQEASAAPRQRIYMLSSLLFLLVASVHPIYLSFENRLKSFSGDIHYNEEFVNQWAQNGFHSDGRGGASCFNCGAHVDKLTECDPRECHAKQHPECRLWRLLCLLSENSEIVQEASGLLGQLRKLFALLLNGQLTGFIESFGFSKDEVTLALIRHTFLESTGTSEPKPGDLIRILQSLPLELLSFLRDLLPGSGTFSNLLRRDLSDGLVLDAAPTVAPICRTEARVTADPVTRINNRNYVQNLDIETGVSATVPEQDLVRVDPLLKEDGSSQCLLCHSRQRDRVTLPCAHLKFCKVCASSMKDCRFCACSLWLSRDRRLRGIAMCR